MNGRHGSVSRRAVLCGLVHFIALAAFPASSGANHLLGLHWAREENPLLAEFGNNGLGSEWSAALRHAGSVWSRSGVLDVWIVPGRTNPRTCRMTPGRVEVCAANYGQTGWVGATRLHRRGEHITAAWIKFNEHYFSPGVAGSDNAKARRNTACHEMGHALGLDHGSSGPFKESCLYADTARRIEHPSQHDFAELGQMYRHTDNYSTLDGARAIDVAASLPDLPVPSGGPHEGMSSSIASTTARSLSRSSIGGRRERDGAGDAACAPPAVSDARRKLRTRPPHGPGSPIRKPRSLCLGYALPASRRERQTLRLARSRSARWRR